MLSANPSGGSKAHKIMKMISTFRVFIIIAMIVSGCFELYATNFFATPVEQIGIGALAGAFGVVVAKISHIV